MTGRYITQEKKDVEIKLSVPRVVKDELNSSIQGFEFNVKEEEVLRRFKVTKTDHKYEWIRQTEPYNNQKRTSFTI